MQARENDAQLLERLRSMLQDLDSLRRRDPAAYREQIVSVQLMPWVRDVGQSWEFEEESGMDQKADLIRILADLLDKKSAALVHEDGEEERTPAEEEEERSEELFQHLLEFSRYREVARELDRRAERMRQSHARIPPEVMEWERVLADIEGADLGELVAALEGLLSRENETEPETIPRERVTVEGCMRRIRGILGTSSGRVNFADLFPRGGGRSLFVGTFIALLELIRRREIRVAQRDRFGDIQVFTIDPVPDEGEEE